MNAFRFFYFLITAFSIPLISDWYFDSNGSTTIKQADKVSQIGSNRSLFSVIKRGKFVWTKKCKNSKTNTCFYRLIKFL